MPLPKGYTLDPPQMKVPAGYTLDAPAATPRPAGLPPGVDLPALPAHPAVSMQPPTLKGPAQKLLGASPIADAGTVIGNHLKNFVAGPYHALTDDPRNAQEAAEMGTTPDSGMLARGLGRIGLAGSRMLVNPTLNSGKEAIAAGKAGDYNTAGQKAMDAIPIVGPWARGIENDAAEHGALPALLGMGTDIAGPSIVGKGAGVLAKPLARSSAISDVTRMIRPNATDTAFGKSPAEGLLNQPGGIFSMSKEGLLDRSKANIGKIGKQIGDVVDNAPQNPIDISGPVTKPFASALDSAAKSNQNALFDRLQETKKGLTSDLYYDPATESIQQAMGPKNLSAVTPSNVFRLKKTVGDNTRWTNQAFDNDVNAAQGEVYGGLKDALNQRLPELQPLNEKYGNLRSGVSALERRLPIEARNNAISLPDTILGGAAALKGSPLAGISTVAAKKLFTSTPIRTGLDAAMWRYGTSPDGALYPSALGLSARALAQQNQR